MPKYLLINCVERIVIYIYIYINGFRLAAHVVGLEQHRTPRWDEIDCMY